VQSLWKWFKSEAFFYLTQEILSPLALQPNLALGHLHETFRFISVTKYKTVGRIPWEGDQLVARILLVH
jgi:hypothetical protein